MSAKYELIKNADGFPICLIETESGVRICTFNSQIVTIKAHAEHILEAANRAAALGINPPTEPTKGRGE